METSFTDLRNKQVINVLSGRVLGNVCDVIFNLKCNSVLGLIVPGTKNYFNIFKPCQEIFVPLSCVCKVGEDVILVEVIEPQQKKKKSNKVRVFENYPEEQLTQNTSMPPNNAETNQITPNPNWQQ